MHNANMNASDYKTMMEKASEKMKSEVRYVHGKWKINVFRFICVSQAIIT